MRLQVLFAVLMILGVPGWGFPSAEAGKRNAAPPVSPGTEFRSEKSPSIDSPHMFNVPLFESTDGTPDFSNLPRLDPPLITIFRGVENESGFNMHPYLCLHEGRFYAMWSSNRIRDLQAGQNVLYAVSDNGKDWSEARQIMPREEEAGLRHFARGFWLRNGQLFALAARDQAVRPLFGPDLTLLGYPLDPLTQTFGDPLVIADDAINNFPPKLLPSGEWMMSRRDHRMAKSMLIGGVDGPGKWEAFPIPAPQDGAELDEPFWWTLPDGTLAAVFRDGSRSQRLYRSFSLDNGRNWTSPVRTDFPDACAKFNVLRLQGGDYAMASNPNTKGDRNPLCLSLSRDGILFDRMLILRDTPTIYRYSGKDSGYAGYHYPQLLEHEGSLYLIHSQNMEDIILLKIWMGALPRIF